MEINKMFELPMLSSELDEEIRVEIENFNVNIIVTYFDTNERKLIICFKNALCHIHTSKRFTKQMLNAYDKIVEVVNSEWLSELQKLNEIDFAFWKPRHFAIYLEKLGMYQIIAQEYEIFDK